MHLALTLLLLSGVHYDQHPPIDPHYDIHARSGSIYDGPHGCFTCASQGWDCGSPPGVCSAGGCGTCTAPEVCAGDGTNYTCGAYVDLVYDHSGGDSTGDLTTLPAALGTPIFVWDARSPTTALTGEALSWTGGAASTVGTPFCFSGDFSDTTSASDCLQAVVFTTGKYLTTDSNQSWAGTDRTVCALVRVSQNPDAVSVIFAHRAGATGEGYILSSSSTGTQTSAILINNAAGSRTSAASGAIAGQWDIVCGFFDVDGSTSMYSFVTNTGAASPANSYSGTLSTPFGIGAYNNGTANGEVAIAALWVWSTASTGYARTLQQYISGMAAIGTQYPDAGTSTDAGSKACWIDGKIWAFAKNWLPVGCQSSHAGTNDPGVLLLQNESNLMTYSRDLTNWTETGTGVVAASAVTDQFEDGRTLYAITDDDGAGAEYASITLAKPGTKFVVIVDGIATTSGDAVDIRVNEQTGCAGNSTDFTAAALSDTSMTRASWLHTWVDASCTEMVLDVGCVAGAGTFTDVAETCGVSVLVQIVNESLATEFAHVYIETSGAAGAFGDSRLQYASASALAQKAGDVTHRYTVDLTPAAGRLSHSTEYTLWRLYIGDDLDATVTSASTFTGDCNATTLTDTTGWTQDTRTQYRLECNYNDDTQGLFKDGVSKDTDTGDITILSGSPTLYLHSGAGALPYGWILHRWTYTGAVD